MKQPWLLVILAGCTSVPVPAFHGHPADARAMAMREPDPLNAFDWAFFLANDRGLARGALDRMTSKDPAALLRRATLAEAELREAELFESLEGLIVEFPDSAEAELGLAMLSDYVAELSPGADRWVKVLKNAIRERASAPHVSLAGWLGAHIAPDQATLTWFLEQSGYVGHLRVLGPIGPAHEPALGAWLGFESQALTDIRAMGHNRAVRSIVGAPTFRSSGHGVHAFETYVEVASDHADGTCFAQLFASGPTRVAVDGTLLFEVSLSAREPRRVLGRGMRVPEGWHRISVLSVTGPASGFALNFLTARGRPCFARITTEIPRSLSEAIVPAAPQALGFPFLARQISSDPQSSATRAADRLLFARASLSAVANDPETAAEDLAAAEATESAFALAWEARRRTTLGVSDTTELLESLRKLDPDRASTHLALSDAEHDDFGQALRHADRAAELAPASGMAMRARFDALLGVGLLADAEQALGAAMRLRPTAQLAVRGAEMFDAELNPDRAAKLRAAARTFGRRPNRPLDDALSAVRAAIREHRFDRADELLAESDDGSVALALERISLELMRTATTAGRQSFAPQALAARLGSAGMRAFEKLAERGGLGESGALGLSILGAQISTHADEVVARPGTRPAAKSGLAELLWDRRILWLRPTGHGIEVRERHLRALSREAAEDLRHPEYDAGTVLLGLRVVTPSGEERRATSHPAKPDAIVLIVEPHDVVEEVTVRALDPTEGSGGHVAHVPMAATIPAHLIEVLVLGEPGGLRSYEHGKDTSEPEDRSTLEEDVWIFRSRDVPAFENADDSVPTLRLAICVDEDGAVLDRLGRHAGLTRSSLEVDRTFRGMTAEQVQSWVHRQIEAGPARSPERTILERRGLREALLTTAYRSIGLHAELLECWFHGEAFHAVRVRGQTSGRVSSFDRDDASIDVSQCSPAEGP